MPRFPLLGMAVAAVVVFSQPSAAAAAPKAGASDVPAGVRLLAARIGGDNNALGRNRGRPVVVFGDSDARPFYFSPEGAECVGACLEKWRPALAPAGARASGDWGLVKRDGGERQWSFRGKALFTYAEEAVFFKDEEAGADSGIRCGGPPSAPCATVAPVLAGQAVDGMTAARAEPASWLRMPQGVGVAEYRLAPGQMLALDVGGATPLGKPLYTFTGSARDERALPRMLRPHYAAELDLPVGDFTIRERPDGSRQWAYRGAALYSCDCDVESGDVNGKNAARGVAPAIVLRYPMPAEVALSLNPVAGAYMVEAKTGQTLYYRDRVKDPFEPDNARPLGGIQDPRVGATLGLKHCDAQCERDWRPLLAPPNAQPQGYWSVYTRPDGALQWAYKNFAIYTHANEPAGVLYGNETYKISYNEVEGGPRAPDEFGHGLLWRGLTP